MVGSGKKLDFWFWVKVAVVGFMLVFQPRWTALPLRTISDFSQRNIIIPHWEEVFLYLW